MLFAMRMRRVTLFQVAMMKKCFYIDVLRRGLWSTLATYLVRPKEQSDSAMKECETDGVPDTMFVLRLRACFECELCVVLI